MPTEIEWTNLLPGFKGETWNPVTGCEKVSAGCKFCYAEKFAGRKMNEWGKSVQEIDPNSGLPRFRDRKFTDVICYENRLDIPLKWKKPRLIFVNSMSDLFHEAVPFEFIDKVFDKFMFCNNHIFIILTKRPVRALAYYNSTDKTSGGLIRKDWLTDNVADFRHVWFGVSVEDQKTADERIPLLLQVPAFIRWVSYEPALGPVDFTQKRINYSFPTRTDSSGVGIEWTDPGDEYIGLDWIVMGGESGHKARPMNPEWVRKTRDDCKAANVRFFFKQWGEWIGTNCKAFEGELIEKVQSGKNYKMHDWENTQSWKVGRKLSGRVFDSKEYNEYPVNGLQ